jgi:hypothetical protein
VNIGHFLVRLNTKVSLSLDWSISKLRLPIEIYTPCQNLSPDEQGSVDLT